MEEENRLSNIIPFRIRIFYSSPKIVRFLGRLGGGKKSALQVESASSSILILSSPEQPA
jgi:hypothetical protein